MSYTNSAPDRYVNVSGGPDSPSWKIRYDCDAGFELFGKADRQCAGGEWEEHDEEFVAHCATNVALSKPAEASSEVGAGTASKAVDGRRSTVHEGSKVSWFFLHVLELNRGILK